MIAKNIEKRLLQEAMNGKHEQLRQLLKQRDNHTYINTKDDGNMLTPKGKYIGMTPLLVAAHWGHLESVKILLEHGADIYALNAHNQNILFLAALNNKMDIIKYIAIYLKDNPDGFERLLIKRDSNTGKTAYQLIVERMSTLEADKIKIELTIINKNIQNPLRVHSNTNSEVNLKKLNGLQNNWIDIF